MAGKFDGAGVITKTFEDLSVVSFSIDGNPRSFLFSKTIFFTFGVPCEGSMRNLLEEGMDVELCYEISGDKRRIVAVWLGDKPDFLTEDKTTLSPLYNRAGRILEQVDFDNFLARDEDDHTILISKAVVFRDGSPFKENLEDENIVLDILPLEFKHPSGASYRATCAWIGEMPRMVERFGLRFLDVAGFSGEDAFVGTVAVIPNDVVGLVDVTVKSVVIKVLLFRASFGQKCERIQDVVDIGDSVCLRLGYGCIFGGSRQWYAKRAFKTSDEVSDADLSEERLCEVTGKITELDNGTEKPCSTFETHSKLPFKTSGLVGVISKHTDGNKACIVYENFRVLVDRDDFYIDSKPCSEDDFVCYVAPGNKTVRFHAISTKLVPCQRQEDFLYRATCAWVGGKFARPSVMAAAATLPLSKMSLLKEKDQVFYGIVSKFVLPKAALAVIPGVNATVVVYVGSFKSPPQRPPETDSEKILITNYVKLKDYVEFKVRIHAYAPNTLEAYDVQPALFTEETRKIIELGGAVPRKPCLNSQENTPLKGLYPQREIPAVIPKSPDLTSAVSAPLASASACSESEAISKPLSASVHSDVSALASSTNTVQTVLSAISVPKTIPDLTDTCGPSAPSASPVWGITPVKKVRLSQGRGFLLNCEGKLNFSAAAWEHLVASVKISSILGTVTSTVNLNAKFHPSDMPLVYQEYAIRFNAKFSMSPKENTGFTVCSLWDADSAQPKSEHLLASVLKSNSNLGDLNIWDHYKSAHVLVSELAKTGKGISGYPFGKIKSIPYHDCAIAMVDNVPVLVTFESLQTDEEIDFNTASMDAYLAVGDNIVASYEKRTHEGKSYFRTVKCYAFTNPRPGSNLQTILTRKPSTRNNFWRFGEKSRKAPVVLRDGSYFLECVSSNHPQLKLTLKLFEKGPVFINGSVAVPETFENYVGHKMTFHASHRRMQCDELLTSDVGMSIVCAWIGEEPSPYAILKDVLMVPKGLVCPAWRYDAVVHSFPLPSYALCYVGYVPVLVRVVAEVEVLAQFLIEKEVVEDLKIGDRIAISVQERLMDDSVVVYSNDIQNMKRTREVRVQDVYLNLSGTVVVLPEPVGKIKIAGGDFEVSFELCHVRKLSSVSCKKWLASVKSLVTIGKRVYVSAVKSVSNFKKVPYRAIEVSFD